MSDLPTRHADVQTTVLPVETQDPIRTDAYDMMKDRQYAKTPRDGKWPK